MKDENGDTISDMTTDIQIERDFARTVITAGLSPIEGMLSEEQFTEQELALTKGGQRRILLEQIHLELESDTPSKTEIENLKQQIVDTYVPTSDEEIIFTSKDYGIRKVAVTEEQAKSSE